MNDNPLLRLIFIHLAKLVGKANNEIHRRKK